ncbi:MAG TPA: transposase family protein [Streptosporangiaceae bacterium]|nr:transposase family protein [Streptosporangiaceae bacterium]
MTDEPDKTGELTVRVAGPDEVAWYNALMAGQHSLGVAASGRVLRYVAEIGGVPLVLGTFGSAAWRVPVRDGHIGWSDVQRAARLERMCCNQRLCVLPAAKGVPHAASRALGGMLRALPGDYLAAFGVRLMAAESFTDPATHAGTVYAACGFTAAGATAGYGRSRGRDHYVHHGRPKTCWLRELVPGGIAALAAGFDSPVLAGRRAPDFNRLDLGGEHGLLHYLGKVTDHRKPKGVRHGLAAILAVIVVARLSGANSVYAAGQFAATMPQEALRRCGIRYSTRLRRYAPPSPKTIKRAVRAVDAAASDEQMCAWLRHEAACGRLKWRHIAIDGKTVRGALQPGGTRPHLLAACDVTGGTVPGQAEVDGKTSEITCFVPLLQAILDGRDARDSRGPGDQDNNHDGNARWRSPGSS